VSVLVTNSYIYETATGSRFWIEQWAGCLEQHGFDVIGKTRILARRASLYFKAGSVVPSAVDFRQISPHNLA
jgi:hypothetical protein